MNMKKGHLTTKQRRFCEEYRVDWNGKEAALRAGYHAGNAKQSASELLKLPKIRAEIAKHEKRIEKKHNITVDGLVQEYASIAYANLLEMLTFDDAGFASVDLITLKERPYLGKLIHTLEMDTVTHPDGTKTQKCKIKLHSKDNALNQLAKHVQFSFERSVHEHHHHVFTEEDKDILEHHKRRVIQAYEADKARKEHMH